MRHEHDDSGCKSTARSPRPPTSPIALICDSRSQTVTDGNNLVAGDAVERSIGSKAQAARFAELSLPIWGENSHEVSVCHIIFPNARHRVHRTEWMLARDNNVAVGRDCQIERTQFGIGN